MVFLKNILNSDLNGKPGLRKIRDLLLLLPILTGIVFLHSCIKDPTIPKLATSAAVNITVNSATTGGYIIDDGRKVIIERGVCWGTSQNPVIKGSHTTDGKGSGSFVSSITGLTPNTSYYVRAYATNEVGTGYGNEIIIATNPIIGCSLTTIGPVGITATTAISGGNITSDGGGEISQKGVCWNTNTNPTIDNFKTADGTGTGIFVSNLTNLQPGKTYYVKAYATNISGTSYGNEYVFTTNAVIPELTTGTISLITANTAKSGGNITYDGGGAITERGLCWSTTQNPKITDSFTNNGTGTGSYESNMSGLLPGIVYFVRAYAKNSAGIAYGEQLSFRTKIADAEGNLYTTVMIGTQLWMAENLRSTKFNDNTTIPNVTVNTDWINLAGPAYCWFNNDISYKPTFGALYNWYTINTGKLCPASWHVPTDAEFNTLEIQLGMSPGVVDVWGWRGTDQGTQMKSTMGWDAGGNGTNSSGFTGLAGGYRQGATGNWAGLGILTYWWSSTEQDTDLAWYRRLDGDSTNVYKASTLEKGGKYVRCIRN